MKKNSIILFIISTILLTGCAPSGNASIDSQERVENTMPPELEQMDNEMLDLETYSLVNGPSEYAQSSYPWNRISKGDEGYFYELCLTMRLADPKSESLYVVCNKPNCRHSDESCVATTMNTPISMQTQIYYKGYVYAIGRNEETGYACLYRLSADGSTREEYMQLFRYDREADFIYPSFVINHDTIYYMDENEEQPCIRKCVLGEEEPTVIFASGRSDGTISRLKVYGDFLFFQAGIVCEDGDVKAGIYAYNMRTGETKLVLKHVIAEYTIVDSKIYYSYDGDIYSYDLCTAENVKIIEADVGPNFVSNSQYIVLDNMEAYSWNGEYVCKLAIKNFYDILGMDEDYILAQGPAPKTDEEPYIPKLLVKPASELDDKPFTEYICED